jgi:hypothetical protein
MKVIGQPHHSFTITAGIGANIGPSGPPIARAQAHG